MSIDDRQALLEQISEAVTSHGLWKDRLMQAIETGRSQWTPGVVSSCRNCDFGTWLDRFPEDLRDEHYQFMVTTHMKFHIEAAHVLERALDGDKEAAKALIAPGSDYSSLTTQLIMGAGLWMSSLNS
jgi:hypothetical protein